MWKENSKKEQILGSVFDFLLSAFQVLFIFFAYLVSFCFPWGMQQILAWWNDKWYLPGWTKKTQLSFCHRRSSQTTWLFLLLAGHFLRKEGWTGSGGFLFLFFSNLLIILIWWLLSLCLSRTRSCIVNSTTYYYWDWQQKPIIIGGLLNLSYFFPLFFSRLTIAHGVCSLVVRVIQWENLLEFRTSRRNHACQGTRHARLAAKF